MIFDKRIAIISSLFTITLIFTGNYWLSSLGMGLCIYNILYFIKALGKTIPIIELLLLVATVQWVLGPFFDYRFEIDHFRYKMYVDEEIYMQVVVPAMFAFQSGIMIILRKIKLDVIYNNLILVLKNYGNVPYFLIVLGFVSPYLSLILPSSFRFVLYLLANVKFIGILYLFFQGKNLRHWLFWVIMGLLFLNALQSGMFHDFILWSAIMFSFLVLRFQWPVYTRLAFITAGLVFAVLIQSIKQEFRARLSEKKGEEVSLFFDLMGEEIENKDELFSDENLDMLNVRLNQGWIISAVINNIPEYEPYDRGYSIKEAVYNSILPRFLNPLKKKAGGRENFRKFTGLEIGDQTSMGISIIGEAYGNYGKNGTYIFMFIWGIVIALFFKRLVKHSLKYPTFILWLPLIFLHALKAETEMYVVLNHMVKASILTGLLFFIFFRVFNKSI